MYQKKKKRKGKTEDTNFSAYLLSYMKFTMGVANLARHEDKPGLEYLDSVEY